MLTRPRRTTNAAVPRALRIAFVQPDERLAAEVSALAERARSNTPQQALALLNDPTYVEAARVFAGRIMAEGGTSISGKIDWAYHRALSRSPRDGEVRLLSKLYNDHLEMYRKDRKAAEKLLGVGMAPRGEGLPPLEVAAWMSVTRVILNLHETITRE